MSKRKHTSRKHRTAKKQKFNSQTCTPNAPGRVLQPLLAHCYHEVKSLKDYLLAALPASSRVRRKRLLSFINSVNHAQFFATTLVGIQEELKPATIERRLDDLTLFTQTLKAPDGVSATSQHLSIHEVGSPSD